jgi:hypothetical protein
VAFCESLGLADCIENFLAVLCGGASHGAARNIELRHQRHAFSAARGDKYRFAVEIRNSDWLVPKLGNALRERGIALALIDQSWMPRPAE